MRRKGCEARFSRLCQLAVGACVPLFMIRLRARSSSMYATAAKRPDRQIKERKPTARRHMESHNRNPLHYVLSTLSFEQKLHACASAGCRAQAGPGAGPGPGPSALCQENDRGAPAHHRRPPAEAYASRGEDELNAVSCQLHSDHFGTTWLDNICKVLTKGRHGRHPTLG